MRWRWYFRYYLTAGFISAIVILSNFGISLPGTNDRDDDLQAQALKQLLLKRQRHLALSRNETVDDEPSESGKIKWADFDSDAYLKPQKMPQDAPATKKYEKFQFNQAASDSTPVARIIPDVRSDQCKKTYFSDDLPPVSVIITFHNEARSALLRTIFSVFRTVPVQMLTEIILVDDYSDDPEDGALLAEIQKVRVLRNEVREGLIRSRIKGATAAKASILTFLDSHCECVRKWIEPLVTRVLENPKRVVSPVIDVINMDSFQYTMAASNLKGGFGWSMVFKWDFLKAEEEQRHKKDKTAPIKTPVMAGGLFAVSKERFFEIGAYDPQMDVWGGENLELSLRVWMCGGQLEIAPCSRVGHVFRKQHPYTFPGGKSEVFLKNTRRMVEVWLDKYSEFYYREVPLAREVPFGDISDRMKLKNTLQCKSFSWYLKNVYPELRPASDKANIVGDFGKIEQTGRCLSVSGSSTGTNKSSISVVHSKLKLLKCFENGDLDDGSQNWLLAIHSNGAIRSGDLCLTSLSLEKPGERVFLQRCEPASKLQKWLISRADTPEGAGETAVNLIRLAEASLCLDAQRYRTEGLATLSVEPCESSRSSQHWRVIRAER